MHHHLPFFNCSSLESIHIPESVEFLGESVFRGCSKITSITIPNGIKRIYYLVFAKCENLTSVIIPESVERIQSSSFAGCNNLASVTCYAKTPPGLNRDAFSYYGTLHVLPGCKQQYLNSDMNWKLFNIVEDADTEIEWPSDNEASENIAYDLLGQPVDDSYKGIVVRNGKKTFIR